MGPNNAEPRCRNSKVFGEKWESGGQGPQIIILNASPSGWLFHARSIEIADIPAAVGYFTSGRPLGSPRRAFHAGGWLFTPSSEKLHEKWTSWVILAIGLVLAAGLKTLRDETPRHSDQDQFLTKSNKLIPTRSFWLEAR